MARLKLNLPLLLVLQTLPAISLQGQPRCCVLGPVLGNNRTQWDTGKIRICSAKKGVLPSVTPNKGTPVAVPTFLRLAVQEQGEVCCERSNCANLATLSMTTETCTYARLERL